MKLSQFVCFRLIKSKWAQREKEKKIQYDELIWNANFKYFASWFNYGQNNTIVEKIGLNHIYRNFNHFSIRKEQVFVFVLFLGLIFSTRYNCSGHRLSSQRFPLFPNHHHRRGRPRQLTYSREQSGLHWLNFSFIKVLNYLKMYFK